MTWLNALSVLAVAAAAASTPDPPATLPEPADAELIKLQREANERVTVPVTIMGQGPFRFMVDTGAQATVVSSALADRLGLTERSSAVLVGMASRVPVETTEISQFTLGSRQFQIRTAAIVEGENLGGADGILGLDSLQDQRVLIDFQKQQIYVADAKRLGGNGGYEIVVKARRRLGQLIITGAHLNGIAADVIIDTGAQASVGNMALLDRLRRAKALGDSTMTDVNGKDFTAAVRVGRKLDIGNMTLSDVPILFADTPALAALGMNDEPALILGINQLKAFRRVAIDFSKQQVLFDLPREVRQQSAL
jgi:predicted aspartyl protease